MPIAGTSDDPERNDGEPICHRSRLCRCVTPCCHSHSLPPHSPPPASACTQPLGIGPEEPDSAMQSSPLAFDEGASIGYGHNSAWYEYNPSIGAFVRVYSWYDPASDTTPLQPDEIDVTDDPELGLAGLAASAASTQRNGEETISCDRGFPLPSRTVTATIYGGGGGSLIGFLWRSIMLAAGGGSGSRVAIRGQWAEVTINNSERDCDDTIDEVLVCGSVMHWLSLQGGGAVRPPGQGQWFRIVYRDGQHQTWQGTGVNGVCVGIRKGCHRP